MVSPKVLVLSNECFSKMSSNGRTLGNFFVSWPKKNLAQFYVSGTPDIEFCENYFHVSDRHALNAILGRGVCGERITVDRILENTSNRSDYTRKRITRNACSMILRELVWESRRWEKSGYWQWVSEFNPQIVLLQAGDCAFMFNLALRIAKKYKTKFIIYNTEGYYFKKFDYFKGKGLVHFIYPFFHAKLKRAIERGYHKADYSIFNCEVLRDDFCKEFDMKSEVIYTATDLWEDVTEKTNHVGFIVTYAGNLGVGRPQSLVDIADVLQSINPEYYLDVYGSIPNDEVKKLFDNCKGIHFHGRISYDEVKNVMSNSDLLVHVEGFEPYYIEDLKYAFSTKIADYLASNRCFLMYAPVSFAETQYLLDNSAAYVASSKGELKKTVELLVSSSEARSRYLKQAMILAMKNHNRNVSVTKFQEILCNVK